MCIHGQQLLSDNAHVYNIPSNQLLITIVAAVRLLHTLDWQQDPGHNDDDDDDDVLEDPNEDTPDPASPAPFALSASSESTSETPHQASGTVSTQQSSTSGDKTAVAKLQQHVSNPCSGRGNAKAVPLGEVVAVVGRSNQDIVVSLAEEDQKAMQQRQQTNRSVRSVCDTHPAPACNL